MSRRVRRPPVAVLQVAALILAQAGYRIEQITDLLRTEVTAASADSLTNELLRAGADHFAATGFTYYGITNAAVGLAAKLPPPPPDSTPQQPSADQPELF